MRLGDLNRQAEDPSLWNDSARAQKVMRQRQSLEAAITGYKKIEQELDDVVTLLELGEAEDDDATLEEGGTALKGLLTKVKRREVEALLSAKPTATIPISKSMPVPAAQKARTGRRCFCACICAGVKRAATKSR
jgi:hypothetical protein